MACTAFTTGGTFAVRQQVSVGAPSRSRLVVRAEGETPINPGIQKDSPKVADTVLVAELAKPVTAYCRCWRSKMFPLCDGSHVKFNEAAGDNVGPLVLKK